MPINDNYPYRVFISYSHQDKGSAEKLANYLVSLNLQPIWDREIPTGWDFLDSVKKQIVYSHLFIPILTPQSVQSSWVNHEIGYAMGRNVPVLPLGIGQLPEGMVEVIQAEVAEHIEDLFPRLTRDRLNILVRDAQTIAMYECADHVETRSEAIVKYCTEVKKFVMERKQPLRHRAMFGTFTIPLSPRDPIWRDRNPELILNPHRIELLCQERASLEKYVLDFGCDLFLYPKPKLIRITNTEVEARLIVFRLFLVKMIKNNVKVRVVFDESAASGNLLIIGDWFFAESITPKADGFRHTTLTCHAPTVLKELENFDMEFHNFEKKLSAESAVEWVEEQLSALRE